MRVGSYPFPWLSAVKSRRKGMSYRAGKPAGNRPLKQKIKQAYECPTGEAVDATRERL